jgi:hypothetical protein
MTTLDVYRPTDESMFWVRRWAYKVHLLKTLQPYFGHVASGAKTFEVRFDDRGFQPSDLLVLCEFDGAEFTGQDATREIRYVLRQSEMPVDVGLKPGFVVLGIGTPRAMNARRPS